MKQEKGWMIGVIVGIALIAITASLMILPFENQNKEQNPVSTAIEKVKDSENRMLDFIDQEKAEFSSKIDKFPYP